MVRKGLRFESGAGLGRRDRSRARACTTRRAWSSPARVPACNVSHRTPVNPQVRASSTPFGSRARMDGLATGAVLEAELGSQGPSWACGPERSSSSKTPAQARRYLRGQGARTILVTVLGGMPNSRSPPNIPPKVTSSLPKKPPLGHSPFLGTVPYGMTSPCDLIAAPALMCTLLTDANGAPGTVATAGTSVCSSQEYLPELRTHLPIDTTSTLTGVVP